MNLQANKLIAVAIILLTLTGCYSAGNSSLDKADETSIAQALIAGKTTKAEVISIFGQPFSRSPLADEEIWRYQYTKARAKATAILPGAGIFFDNAKYDRKILTILFNADETVRSYTWSDVEDVNNQ